LLVILAEFAKMTRRNQSSVSEPLTDSVLNWDESRWTLEELHHNHRRCRWGRCRRPRFRLGRKYSPSPSV